MLSDFETFERSAIRRGIDVQRAGNITAPVVGRAWDITFTMRGKQRNMNLVLARYDTPNTMRFDANSQGLEGALELELLPLSPRRTRMSVAITLAPKTLSARLLVQSLKLAKGNLTKRFKLKVADYAKTLEEKFSRMA